LDFHNNFYWKMSFALISNSYNSGARSPPGMPAVDALNKHLSRFRCLAASDRINGAQITGQKLRAEKPALRHGSMPG
jgi:hypothetical protein